MCVVGVFCLFQGTTNSTVVNRELTPWSLRSVDDLVLEERNRSEERPDVVEFPEVF